MTEECPHLTYRTEGDDRSFDVARAFCTVTDSFVQPMRADVCNARYGLDPERDCEFYVAPERTDGGTVDPANGADDPTEADAAGGDEDR